MKKKTTENNNAEEQELKQEQEENTDENQHDQPDVEIQEAPSEEEVLSNKLLRLQADFLNYKNRTEKEKFTTYGGAVSDVIKDLLPVIDNLERALEVDKSQGDDFKKGIEMIYTQFYSILDKKGLKQIEALNKAFDHNVHYGVAFEAETEAEDGTVIEVFQKGYTVNDKVIRPSMVKIAKK